MAENLNDLLEAMMTWFQEDLAELLVSTMTPADWDDLQSQARYVFRPAAQRFLDSEESEAPDAMQRLRGAVSELAAAVREQVLFPPPPRPDVVRAISLGPVQRSLRRICPLFPFC